MELFLIRDAGREGFRRSVKGLAHLGVGFDRIRHSPLLPAVETADLLIPLLDGETEVDGTLARAPDSDLVASLTGERLALVGHEPWMSQLLGLLVRGELQREVPVDLKKGGVAWLRGRPGPAGMELVAFLPPRVLRRL